VSFVVVAGSHPKIITYSADSEDDIIIERSEEGRMETAEQIRVYRHRDCVRVSHFWRLDHHCPFKHELCRVATVLMGSTNWVGLELGTGSKIPMGVESSQAAKRHNICQLLVLHVSDSMHKTFRELSQMLLPMYRAYGDYVELVAKNYRQGYGKFWSKS
jgi:hypothetical protein